MKIKMYEMVMEFDITIGLKEINDFAQMFGFQEKACIPNQTITLSQTVPFIPDEEHIHKYENIIKEKYQTEHMNIIECRFKGYKKLLEKNIEVEEKQEKEQLDDELEME